MRNMNLVEKSQKLHLMCTFPRMGEVKTNVFFYTHPTHHTKLQWPGFDHEVFMRVGGSGRGLEDM
jgi:hypothetical protein